MTRKKICFVVPELGTARVFLLNHIKELSLHFDICLVASVDSQVLLYFKDVPLKTIKNITVPRNISLLRDLKSLRYLYAYFKEMEFDAVHTITPKVGFLGLLASRLAGIENRIHIFTGQVWHTKTGLFKYFLKTLDRFTVFNATHILVDGHSQRRFLIKNNIVKPSNSFVLGKGSISGVNVKRFTPNTIVRKQVRQSLAIQDSELVFMFLGRINTDKGINELAHAFNRLQQANGHVRLLLAGTDEENMTPRIKQIVKNTNSVIFHGVTTTPEHLLQGCDVFCMPSYREGFGTSVIEASLLEKPVICSDTYGLMETIVDNKTGLRHKVADIESLFLAMKQLADDHQLRNLLGAQGRAYVLEHFSDQTISKKWLEFYIQNIKKRTITHP